MNSQNVVLPTFLICGAAKSGTTSLYHYLRGHANVYMSSEKETRFFSSEEHFRRGVSWFQQFFKEYEGEKAIGEADTGTMYYRGSAARVHEIVPGAKLIFVLRNPIEQVYSHYWFGAERGIYDCQVRSFSEFIRDNEDRWTKKILSTPKYYDQLVRFDPYFDKEHRLTLLFDDIQNNIQHVMNKIYRFIEVEPCLVSDARKHNVTSYPSNPKFYRRLYRLWKPIRQQIPKSVIQRTVGVRSTLKNMMYSEQQGKPSMDLADRTYLREMYREPNAHLAEYLDRDLSHWT